MRRENGSGANDDTSVFLEGAQEVRIAARALECTGLTISEAIQERLGATVSGLGLYALMCAERDRINGALVSHAAMSNALKLGRTTPEAVVQTRAKLDKAEAQEVTIVSDDLPVLTAALTGYVASPDLTGLPEVDSPLLPPIDDVAYQQHAVYMLSILKAVE